MRRERIFDRIPARLSSLRAGIGREGSRFLLVGATTVLIDFSSYSLLLWFGVPLSVAKTCGFLIGTIFAYFANKYWTFSAPHTPHSRVLSFAAVYLFTLGVNVGVNDGLVTLLGSSSFGLGAAFIVATGMSAVINFAGMKVYVFGVRSDVGQNS